MFRKRGRALRIFRDFTFFFMYSHGFCGVRSGGEGTLFLECFASEDWRLSSEKRTSIGNIHTIVFLNHRHT